jgi:hypothetical protein
MPDVETDNDAAGDNLQSGVATFFWRPVRMIRMASTNGTYELRRCRSYLISLYFAQFKISRRQTIFFILR